MKHAYSLRLFLGGLFFLFCGGTALFAQVSANAGEDTNVCDNNCIVIGEDTAFPGLTYQWNALSGSPINSLSDPSIAQPEACPGITTTYQFIVNDPILAASDTDTIVLTIMPDFSVSHFTDSSLCRGQFVDFDIQPNPAGNDYTYFWIATNQDTFSDPSVANPTVYPSSNGVYSVLINDTTSNCQLTFPITLTVPQLNVTATPASELINSGQRVQIDAFTTNASGGVTYTWSPDDFLSCINCPSPVAHATEGITYTVTAVDTAGCIGTATVVLVTDSLMIPNVFTPNGDGINDLLKLNYYGDAVYEILVFDRWGNQMFRTSNKQEFWDGKNNNGEDAPEGVYYLSVRIAGDAAIPERNKQRAFSITLLR